MVKKMRSTAERAERRSIRGQTTAGVGLATFFVTAVFCSILLDNLDFGPFLRLNQRSLTDLGPRLKFVIQQTSPALIWLGFCAINVIVERSKCKVLYPYENSDRVEDAKNILTNSVEQFVMLLASQLILATYLTGKQALNIVPSINILFISGRLLFFSGYPKKTTFGFLLGFEPILISMAYIGYRYITSIRII